MVTAAQMRDRHANRKRRGVRKAEGGGLTGWADLPVDANDMAALRQRRAVRPNGGRREGAATRGLDAIGASLYETAARPSRIWNALQEVPAGQPLSERPDIIDAGAMTAADIAGVPAMTGNIVPGAAGIFGGRLAKTANLDALKRAEEMAAKGVNREQIWNETGWFKGSDNKWRFEIDDSASRLNPSYSGGLPKLGKPQPVAGQLWHRDLYDAYPDVRNAKMRIEQGPDSGRYMAGDVPVVQVEATSPGSARSIGLHELQHDVQHRENFSRGTSPEAMSQRVTENTGNPIIEQLRDAIATGQYGMPGDPGFSEAARSLLMLERQSRVERASDAYRRSAGEVEARNVQARGDMTPEQRRAKPPWETEDVPVDRQIVREGYAGGGAPDLPDAPWADSALPDAPWAEPTKAEDIGLMRSALAGAEQGVTAGFSDELRGASAAANMPRVARAAMGPLGLVAEPAFGVAKLGVEYLTGGDEASKRYRDARDQERVVQKLAKEQHPYIYGASNIAGAVALPGGAIMQGATLPLRIARGAIVGAGYGALSGAGEGEGLADSATRAAIGAPVGAVVGAIAPPLVEGVAAGVRQLARPLATAWRGATNPEGEAGRRVIDSVRRDMDTGSAGMTPQEFFAARNAGAPVALADLGGETTRALARSAANTTPEGRAALERLASERFEGQADRASDFIRNLVGGNVDTGATREALRVTARSANRPAYNTAYNHPNAQGMWDEGFEQISQAPVVQSAIRAASVTGANRGTIEGLPRIQSPFTIDRATGQLVLRTNEDGSRMLPNLQFWDHVKRNLDQINTPEARTLNTALKSHLDDLVPAYRDARAGAARFFGADDALTAGENFVGRSMDINDARRAVAAMTPDERDLFRQGYAAQLIDNVRSANDRTNPFRQFNTPAARERRVVALGPNEAARVETFLQTEQTMDRLRTALQGNSTTVRQWVERGMAGGSAIELGSGTYHSDPRQLGAAAILGGLALGSKQINTMVARRVADMLVSNEPAVLARGVQMIARNQNLREAFGDMDRRLARAVTQQISPHMPRGIGILPAHTQEQKQQ